MELRRSSESVLETNYYFRI